MTEKECIPFAPSLIESMRAIGYSFKSAIADLLDNSISAKANRIDIISDPGINPSLIILDNGCGMKSTELYEAMRYGSTNPLDDRKEDDLGRFGLGLKAASLSQCRKLIVVSKVNNEISSYSWDLDYVLSKKRWMLKVFSKEEINDFPYIDLLKNQKEGTYIFLSDFDRINEGTNNLEETFNRCLKEMNDHLSLVFHRYIGEGLSIYVNNVLIEPKDPFLSYHKGTQIKKEKAFYIENEKISLKPYILPHPSKLKEEDIIKVGGKERMKKEQGFYIYRNKRLIIWGTWFNLQHKEELNKLARVRVDIPNSLDYMWSIDIKKSSANLPDKIKDNMFSAILESVRDSTAVYEYRGRTGKNQKGKTFVWKRELSSDRSGWKYVINKELPQIQLLQESMTTEQKKMFAIFINQLESSFPYSAVYFDVAKDNIETERKEDNKEIINQLWAEIEEQFVYIKNRGLDKNKYCKMFLELEPYCNYQEIKNRLNEEMK